MLIKDTKEDIIKEISVNITFSFGAVEPYLKNEATDFIKAVLGNALYKALDDAYTDAGSLEKLAEKWRVLLPLCQRPLVYYGYLKYLPFGDVSVSDGGISVKRSDTSAPASAARVQALKDAMRDIAWTSLEKLIKFLYANGNMYDWDGSKQQTKWITGLINFSDQLNEHTNTTLGSEVFNKMKASVKFVEENAVRSLIFADLYDKIKDQVLFNLFEDEEEYDWTGSGSGGAGSGGDDENLVNHKILLDLLRPGIANLALAHGLASQRIDISTAGITETFMSERSEGGGSSSPVRNEVLGHIVMKLTEAGNLFLKRAKDYLIENAADFPLYTESSDYDEDETVDDSVYENDDEDGKSFGFY
jgi:hypothetical protein